LHTMLEYDWQPSTGLCIASPMLQSNGRTLLPTRPRGGLAIRAPNKPQ
jgi:hypothetical protein